MSINALAASASFSCGMSVNNNDYQEIIRKLRAYGVTPSGDYYTDKAKLNKIEEAKDSKNTKFSNSGNKEKPQEVEKNNEPQIVDKGEGTDQLAMLNRLQLGLM